MLLLCWDMAFLRRNLGGWARGWNWNTSEHSSALESGGKLLSCGRGGMEMLLLLICRGEAWAIFSISFEDYPSS